MSVSIEIEGFDDQNNRLPESGIYEWNNQGSSPAGTATLIECALLNPWLDYRRLLGTHFTHLGANNVDIFDLMVKQVLDGAVNPASTRSFGEDVTRIEALLAETTDRMFKKLPDLMVKRVQTGQPQALEDPLLDAKYREIRETAENVNAGLAQRCREISTKANLLLKEFDPNLRIRLTYKNGSLDDENNYTRPRILLSAVQYGRVAKNHHEWFNEARLSAIAISLFLSSVLTLPAPGLKALVLDDILIGLDMSNRYPVLRILEKHFKEWQIVLLTHDFVWYDMIRLGLDPDKWAIYEIYRKQDIDAGFDRPVLLPSGAGPDQLLKKAREHLASHDARSAAVYARAGFEGWAKNRAHKKGLAVPYSKDPRDPKIDGIWQAIQDSCKDAAGNIPPAKSALIAGLNAARKVVLNPWSHGTGAPVTEPEIQAAIHAVEALKSL